MENNEANENKDLFDSIQDDYEFNERLSKLVYYGELSPIHAIQLYCHWHDMNAFGMTNLKMVKKTPRLEYVESVASELQDDAQLIEAVQAGDLLPCHALYLFCSRHDINDFEICNLRQPDDTVCSPVLEFIDAILVDDFGDFIRVMDINRWEGSVSRPKLPAPTSGPLVKPSSNFA